MALSLFGQRKLIKDAIYNAVGEYQQGYQQEEIGHHRDAYIWYIKAKSGLEAVQENYGSSLSKENKFVVSEHLSNISKRLPICKTLAAEEMITVTKKLKIRKRNGDLAGYELNQQDIITNFDQVMFERPLTDAQKKAFPKQESDCEYSDSSNEEEDVDLHAYTNEEELNLIMDKYEKSQQKRKERSKLKGSYVKPGGAKACQVERPRPKKPRVLSKKFKEIMSRKQPWDELKPMVYTRLLNLPKLFSH